MTHLTKQTHVYKFDQPAYLKQYLLNKTQVFKQGQEGKERRDCDYDNHIRGHLRHRYSVRYDDRKTCEVITGWLYLTYTKSIRNQTIPADLELKLFDAMHNSQSYCVVVMRSWSNMKIIEHVQLNFCRRIVEDSNYKFYVCDIC